LPDAIGIIITDGTADTLAVEGVGAGKGCS
jgi:hypothetical protein